MRSQRVYTQPIVAVVILPQLDRVVIATRGHLLPRRINLTPEKTNDEGNLKKEAIYFHQNESQENEKIYLSCGMKHNHLDVLRVSCQHTGAFVFVLF